MLGKLLGRKPALLQFDRHQLGRPELIDTGRISFSLSHTDDLVACAVSGSGIVGMDVEPDRGRADSHAIAERFFTPAEARTVREQGDGAFVRLWTLKEAFVKATGEGLRRPLDSFQFALDPVKLETGGDGQAWRFAQLKPSPVHWAAVALRDAPPHASPLALTCRTCRPENLQ